MPGLLSGSASLKGTTGLTSVFITLPTAQPNLGVTPTTSTGYTLVTTIERGQLAWTSTLGDIYFKDRVIQSGRLDTDLVIQSAGTGSVRLLGNIEFNGTRIDSTFGSFTNLVAYNATITDLLVQGKIDFTSATSTATFAGNVIMNQDLRVNEQFDAYGNVGLNPDNGIVYIRPTGVGTVLIRPGATGLIDNMNIGSIAPAVGSFTNLTAQVLTVTSIATINNLVVSTSTFNGTVTVNNTFTATTIYGLAVYDNGTRVITNVVAGTGLSGGGTGPGVTLNNTGVLSLTAGTDTAVSTSTGNVVVWSTATLDSLTSRSNSTTNAIYAGQLYDSGTRVISKIDVGAGLAINTTTGPYVFMTNTGVTSLTAGTDTVVSTSTGDVTVWNNSTLQSVTDRGATTNNRIHITSAYTGSGTWTDVALQIDGDVGIGNNLYIKGNFYASGQAVITTATIAGNLNSGTDILITVDTGSGSIRFDNTSTLQTVTGRGSETNHIVYFINTTNSVSTNSGAIQITGGVGVGKDIYVGGTATVTGSVYSQDGISAYNNLLYTPKVFVSTSTPVSARFGDFWIDPSVGVEYQFVPNGTATMWIQFIGF